MFKSRKFWLSIVGGVLSIGTFLGLKAIGIDQDTAQKVSAAIGGLFGITIAGTAIINLFAIWKGLEKPK